MKGVLFAMCSILPFGIFVGMLLQNHLQKETKTLIYEAGWVSGYAAHMQGLDKDSTYTLDSLDISKIIY